MTATIFICLLSTQSLYDHMGQRCRRRKCTVGRTVASHRHLHASRYSRSV